jgi:hypothetical protein
LLPVPFRSKVFNERNSEPERGGFLFLCQEHITDKHKFISAGCTGTPLRQMWDELLANSVEAFLFNQESKMFRPNESLTQSFSVTIDGRVGVLELHVLVAQQRPGRHVVRVQLQGTLEVLQSFVVLRSER